MASSWSHLDQLDAGLSSRPSRFDRKYLFPFPSEAERTLYCQYWRERLLKNKVEVEFPKRTCPAAASITDGFSFAYMQEAFVATLLAIAQERSDLRHDAGDDLDDYELWRELKKTVEALRNDMDNKEKSSIDGDLKALALKEVHREPLVVANPLPEVNMSKDETAQVQGVHVDQGAPIIRENKFVYNLE